MKKYFFLVAGFCIGFYLSFLLFNEVHAWFGVGAILLTIGVCLKFLIKFIYKDYEKFNQNS